MQVQFDTKNIMRVCVRVCENFRILFVSVLKNEE